MVLKYGDIECKAIYYGDTLVWMKGSGGGSSGDLDGIWQDALTWNDEDTWG